MIDALNETKGKWNWIFMQDGAKPHTAEDTYHGLKLNAATLASGLPTPWFESNRSTMGFNEESCEPNSATKCKRLKICHPASLG